MIEGSQTSVTRKAAALRTMLPMLCRFDTLWSMRYTAGCLSPSSDSIAQSIMGLSCVQGLATVHRLQLTVLLQSERDGRPSRLPMYGCFVSAGLMDVLAQTVGGV